MSQSQSHYPAPSDILTCICMGVQVFLIYILLYAVGIQAIKNGSVWAAVTYPKFPPDNGLFKSHHMCSACAAGMTACCNLSIKLMANYSFLSVKHGLKHCPLAWDRNPEWQWQKFLTFPSSPSTPGMYTEDTTFSGIPNCLKICWSLQFHRLWSETRFRDVI